MVAREEHEGKSSTLPTTPVPTLVRSESAPPRTEAERVQALRDMMGRAEPGLSAFPEAIRKVVFKNHDRWVLPLYQRYWPEALSGGTLKKLRFLSCNLYSTAPYTVLFSAPRPPFLIGLIRRVGTSIGLAPQTMSRWAGRALGIAAFFLPTTTHRRIAQIGAFIACIDHILDKCMNDADPVERGRRMRGILDGTFTPGDDIANPGALRFLRALKVEMESGIAGDDLAVWKIADQRMREYVDSEVKAMTGVPDPTGCSWRMAGVLGTIDGLVFPVWRYAGAKARAWMYSVSMFVQVMDDWIDLDKDRADIRETPCITGVWTEATVRETWEKTVAGIVDLAVDSGTNDDAYLTFVRETYRMMALEVMEAMGKGSAA